MSNKIFLLALGMHSKCLDKHKMQRVRDVHVVHFGEISEISSERRDHGTWTHELMVI